MRCGSQVREREENGNAEAYETVVGNSLYQPVHRSETASSDVTIKHYNDVTRCPLRKQNVWEALSSIFPIFYNLRIINLYSSVLCQVEFNLRNIKSTSSKNVKNVKFENF